MVPLGVNWSLVHRFFQSVPRKTRWSRQAAHFKVCKDTDQWFSVVEVSASQDSKGTGNLVSALTTIILDAAIFVNFEIRLEIAVLSTNTHQSA